MRCSACQTDLPAAAQFCPRCGKPVGGNSNSPTPADQMRAAQSAAAAAPDVEQELWHGTYSAKALVGWWVAAALVTVLGPVLPLMVPHPAAWGLYLVGVLLLWGWPALYLLVVRLSVEYTLTTQRLIHKQGLLHRVTNRVEVIDIDDVSYSQGPIERLLGVGTIKLLSSDVSDPQLILRGIDDVQRVATLIDNARREERRRRGLYLESV
jgi:membrane protein YdbS with pleckstrin-like domain